MIHHAEDGAYVVQIAWSKMKERFSCGVLVEPQI